MNLMQDYRASHQHPLNRLTHTFGIPIIVASLITAFYNWKIALAMFVFGWCIQVLGHVIEGNKPAFLHQPLHLLTGPFWWVARWFK